MAIVGYRLRVNGGAFSNTEIDVGYVFSYLLEGLEPATTYSVEIQSYDENGVESAWSSVVSDTTFSPTMLVDSEGNALITADGEAIIIYV